jgi:hypothetical protein
MLGQHLIRWMRITLFVFTTRAVVVIFGILIATSVITPLQARDDAKVIEVRTPVSWQVIQRQQFDPTHAHYNNAGGPALGYADIRLSGTCSFEAQQTWQFRFIAHGSVPQEEDWQDFSVLQQSKTWTGTVRIPAGGWYQLQVRIRRGDKIIAEDAVSPVGVGEVFLVAGQSYAAGANEELCKIDDPEQRVVAYDAVSDRWRVANDPQPNVGDGGTIWPPLGDMLVSLLDVPVGFVNLSAGGTASRQWVPGEPLYLNMVTTGKRVGRFRAVLWQQGESDVIEKVSTKQYVHNLSEIRRGLEQELGFSPPWLLAKSTYHPTVYNDPVHEGHIRAAYEELCRSKGFIIGPDTDILGGIHRAGPGSRQHFSAIGQRRAALLWFAAVWQLLSNSHSIDSTTQVVPKAVGR